MAVVCFLFCRWRCRRQARSGRSVRVLYFVAIGLGYIMVEIAFIQRFVLFLGHPTYALTVVVFLMLLSSGAGSMLSRRWFRQPTRVVGPWRSSSQRLLIYVFVLPRLLEALVGLAVPGEAAVSALCWRRWVSRWGCRSPAACGRSRGTSRRSSLRSTARSSGPGQ